MNAPCKGCTDRKVACHGGCEKYLAFRAAADEELARQAKHRLAVEYDIRNACRRREIRSNIEKKNRDRRV